MRKNYATGKAVLGYRSHEGAQTSVDRTKTLYDPISHEIYLEEEIDDIMQLLGPNALLIKNIIS